jgi:hypothetical protein
MATVNNNWPTPVQTDLVKDGWEAIKDLGDAIDTTLGVYADPGLVLLNTTSFSAVASQAISTVFTSTYDNYRIIVALSAASTGQFRLQLRNGASNITASNYSNGGLLMRATAANANFNVSAGDAWRLVEALTANGNVGLSLDLISPNKTEITKMNYLTSGRDATSIMGVVGGGIYDATTAADGFNIIITAGTMTGTVSVYGYNK